MKPTAETYDALIKALGPQGLQLAQVAIRDYVLGFHAGLSGRRPPEGIGRAAKAQSEAIDRLIARSDVGWANPVSGSGAVLVEAYTGVIITGMDKKPIRRAEPAVFPPTEDISFEQYRALFEGFEDNFPHMYLDTEGNVTVGVGTLLPNVEQAIAIHRRFGFTRRADTQAPNVATLYPELRQLNARLGDMIEDLEGRLANVRAQQEEAEAGSEQTANLLTQEQRLQGQIARVRAARDFSRVNVPQSYPHYVSRSLGELEVIRDFLAVLAEGQLIDPARGGYVAGHYADVTRLELPEVHRTALYRERFNDNLRDARPFAWDDSWPVEVKLAYADMAYQLGGTRITAYDDFRRATRRRDWRGAGRESATNTDAARDDFKRSLCRQAYESDPRPYFTREPARQERKSLVEVLIHPRTPVPE